MKHDFASLMEAYKTDRSAVRKYAEAHGITKSAVYQLLQRRGFQFRHGGEATKGVQAGEKNPHWRGGITKERGYVKVQRGGKRIFQHRLVAEEMLGRPLLPKEVVHHKNHKKDDNDPSNLEVKDSNVEHMREHCTSAVMRAKAAKGNEARYGRLRQKEAVLDLLSLELGGRQG